MRLIINLPDDTDLSSDLARQLIRLAQRSARFQQARRDKGKEVLVVAKYDENNEVIAYARDTKTGYSVKAWMEEKNTQESEG